MSKKNKNRQQSLLHNSSENEKSFVLNNDLSSDETDNATGTIGNAATGFKFSTYLKAHWWAVALVVFLTIGTFGAGLKYLEDSARENAANDNNISGEQDQSLLAKLNPFAPAAMPSVSPTPLPLSKEYIYAGSRLLAVEDANASAAPPADLAVWRPGTGSGVWWIMGSNGSQQVTQQWGTMGDKPVPGDYDGDGKTDFSIFRPDTTLHNGTWYILYSSSNSWSQTQWGADDDTLTPADFDGDGRTDIAVWRASNGGWYILKSSDNQALTFTFGSSSEKPAPADYDGDGKADVGLWRSLNKTFYSINSSNSASQTVTFNDPSTEPVSADYDGDGKADFAIRSGNAWYIRNSSNGVIQPAINWQSAGDKAVHNDYDGDGKCDIAVWKDATGKWYIRQSGKVGQSNELRQEQWGTSGDTPVPAFYKR